jgi:hypothetical protein
MMVGAPRVMLRVASNPGIRGAGGLYRPRGHIACGILQPTKIYSGLGNHLEFVTNLDSVRF